MTCTAHISASTPSHKTYNTAIESAESQLSFDTLITPIGSEFAPLHCHLCLSHPPRNNHSLSGSQLAQLTSPLLQQSLDRKLRFRRSWRRLPRSIRSAFGLAMPRSFKVVTRYCYSLSRGSRRRPRSFHMVSRHRFGRIRSQEGV